MFSFYVARPETLRQSIAATLVIVGFLFLSIAAQASSHDRQVDCGSIVAMELNRSWRTDLGAAVSELVVSMDFPGAGIASLSVAAPLDGAEPLLSRVSSECGTLDGGSELVFLERSATHWVFQVKNPGSCVFRVGPQDTAERLDELRLSTGFVPSAFAETHHNGGGRRGVVFAKIGEDEEEIEIEVDPFMDPGPGAGRTLHSALRDLCLSGEVDDHGNSFTCATFLNPGLEMTGSLVNGWGDDEDVFLFVIDGFQEIGRQTVAIEAASSFEISGALYDASGTRLEAEVGGEAGFRMVRSLSAGTYFVRVASRHGDEGPYALSVKTLRR